MSFGGKTEEVLSTLKPGGLGGLGDCWHSKKEVSASLDGGKKSYCRAQASEGLV